MNEDISPLGVVIDISADGTKAKEEMKSLIEDLKYNTVDLSLNLDLARDELKSLGETFKGVGSSIKDSFDGLNLGGLTTAIEKITEMSEAYTKVKSSAIETTQAMEKVAEVSETVGTKATKSMLGLGESFKEVRDGAGNVIKTIEKITDEYGNVTEVVKKFTNGVEDSNKRISSSTMSVDKQIKELYSTYEDAVSKISDVQDRIASAKKDGYSKATIDALKEEESAYKEILKTTNKILDSGNLRSERIEKQIQDRQALEEAQKKSLSTMQKEDDAQAKINDRLKIAIADMKEMYSLKKKLVADKYSSDESRELDKAKFTAGNKSLHNRDKNLTNKSDVADLTDYNDQKSKYRDGIAELNREADAKKMIQLEAEANAELNAQLKDTESLLGQKLKLLSKINSDNANELNYKKQIEEIDAKINSYKENGSDDYLNGTAGLESAYEMQKTIMDSQVATKEMNKDVKQYANNLKSILKLKNEINKAQNSEIEQLNQEELNRVMSQQENIYSNLDADSKLRVDDLNSELATQEEINKAKQEAVLLAQQEKKEMANNQAQAKAYLQTLTEEASLKKQMDNAVSEDMQEALQSKINTILQTREAIYENMGESARSMVSIIEEESKMDSEARASEQKTLDFLSRQKTAYEEMLGLEEERLRIQTELVRTDSNNKFQMARLGVKNKDVSTALANKEIDTINGGLYSSQLAQENKELLAGSRASQEYEKSLMEAQDQRDRNAQGINEYRDALEKLSKTYGTDISQTKEYINASSRLNLIGDITDVHIQAKALESMGTQLDEVREKAKKTDEVFGNLFDRMKDYAGFTIAQTAITGVLGSIDSAWESMKKINDSYTELHKVYDPNASGNDGWKATNWIPVANKMGQTYGYSTADTLDALYQAINYGFGNRVQAQDIAKSALTLSNTGRISEADASKYLISIMEGYHMTSPRKQVTVAGGYKESQIQSIIDQLSFGGMYFPITSGGIGEALQRGGSSMAANGNTLQQSIQMIIAGNVARQDPAVVGNAMKSIAGSFSQIFLGKSNANIRHRGMLEKDTDGMDFFQKDGTIKSTFEIMSELSHMVQTGALKGNNLQQVAQIIGGKDQMGIVLSLLAHLNNDSKGESVLQKYAKQEASGTDGIHNSAEREEAKYINSFQGRLNKIKEEVNNIWLSIFKTNQVNKILTLGVDILSFLNEVISKIGVINTIALGIVGILSFKNKGFVGNFGKAMLTKVAKFTNAIAKLLGKKQVFKLPEEEDGTNSDIKKLIAQQEEVEAQGLKAGEIYSEGFASAIESNTSIDEALQSKLDIARASTRVETEPILNPTEINEATDEIIGDYDDIRLAQDSTRDSVESLGGSFGNSTGEMLSGTESASKGITEVTDATQVLAEDGSRNIAEFGSEADSTLRQVGARAETTAGELDENVGAGHESVAREGESALERGAGSEVDDAVGGMALDGIMDAGLGAVTGGIGLVALPALLMALPSVISKVSGAITDWCDKDEILAGKNQQVYDSAINGSEKYTKQITALQKFQKSASGKQLQALNDEYQAGGLTVSQTKTYFGLLKKVAKIAPETVAFKGANGDPYINMANGVKGLISNLQQLKGVENETLISSTTIGNQWKQVNDVKQQLADQQAKRKDTLDWRDTASGVQSEVESQMYHNSSETISQTASDINGEEIAYNQQQAIKEQIRKANQGINERLDKYVIDEQVQLSPQFSFLNKDEKSSVENLFKGLNLSSSKIVAGQVSDMMSKVASAMTTKTGKSFVGVITNEMAEAKQQYYTGAIKYKQFASKMGIISGQLVKNLHFTPAEAEATTNAKFYKILETAQQNYVTSMQDSASKMGMNGKKLNSAFQQQSTLMAKWSVQASGKSKQDIANAQKTLVSMFTLNPEAGRTLEQKLGISLSTPLKEVAEGIGANKQTKQAFMEAMNDIYCGDPISPKTLSTLTDSITKSVNTATAKADAELKKDKGGTIVSIGMDLIPNTKNAKIVGTKDADAYKEQVSLTARQSGQILHALGVKGIAVKDGKLYKGTAELNAQAVAKLLGANGINTIAVHDGKLYKGTTELNAQATGKILNALGVTGIAMHDGKVYANGVLLTAKAMGKILKDNTARTVGLESGYDFGGGAIETAKATGKIYSDDAQAEASGNDMGRHWYSGAISWIDSVADAIGSAFEHPLGGGGGVTGGHSYNSSIGNFFFAIPTSTDIDSAKSKYTRAYQSVNSHITSLYASNRVGKSGGVGAYGTGRTKSKGGISGGIGAVSFATTGEATPSIDTNFEATGMESYTSDGAMAGSEYFAGVSSSINDFIGEEATQTERLMAIRQQYFNTDDNDLKLNIDLNQRLSNTIANIGNAIQRNQNLQSLSENGNQTIDLMNQEIALLNKKKDATMDLYNAQQKQADDLKNSLSANGFTFNNKGELTNAVSKLQGLESWVNSLPDKVTKQVSEVKNEWEKVPYQYTYTAYRKETSQKPYGYYGGGHEVTKDWSTKDGDYSGSYKEYDGGHWVSGVKKNSWEVPYQKTITKYKYEEERNNQIVSKQVANETKANAKTTISNLQSMVQAYNSLINQTMPSTENSISQLTLQVRSCYNGMLTTAQTVQTQITAIIKKQISERENAINNSANTQTEALSKTLKALEQKHQNASYKQNLASQYSQLSMIESEISNASLNDSLSGQAKVLELQKELQAQQQKINSTISNHEYQEAQNKINNQINAIKSNAQTSINNLNKTWTAQKIQETVNQAMLTGKFKDVEGNIVSVKDQWIKFANEFDGGLGVMGNKIKDDFIDKLQQAKDIMKNISEINAQMGYYNTSSATPKWVVPKQDNSFFVVPNSSFNAGKYENRSNAPQINFNAPLLHVNGSVESARDLQKFTKNLETQVTNHIVKTLRNKGAL